MLPYLNTFSFFFLRCVNLTIISILQDNVDDAIDWHEDSGDKSHDQFDQSHSSIDNFVVEWSANFESNDVTDSNIPDVNFAAFDDWEVQSPINTLSKSNDSKPLDPFADDSTIDSLIS